MKCVILAAGEGKRMHPLTYTRPKVMLPVANKPILEWNLLNAKDANLKDFIFIVGYKSDMVRNYFGNGKKWNVNIEYINQGKPLGTAHAIGIVEKFVDSFLVLSGDTIFGKQDIKNVAKKEMSIGLIEADNTEEYGIVETKDKKVIKIYEKIEEPFTNIINAGIYNFNKNFFDFISKTKKSPRGEYEITDSINMHLKEGKMEGIFLKEWKDIVYPWHLLDANEDMLEKINKKINGTIEKNTTIRPYTAIGNNCHVGNACEVKNSIVMDHSSIPHQNYVGDTVVGQNCNLGAGTKIANLRLDKKNIEVVLNGKKIDTNRRKLGTIVGDNVQTGINSMINVGSLVGNNVFIGPGTLASGEIKSNARIM